MPKGIYARPSLRERLLEHRVIDPITGCWLWTYRNDKNGYGLINWACKKLRVHRLAYIEFVGPIPEELLVLHNCDNPPCFNPDHLYAGTNLDNIKDRESRKRHSHPPVICLPGCSCKRHKNGRRGYKCPPNCSCGLHTRIGTRCKIGCTCGRHVAWQTKKKLGVL